VFNMRAAGVTPRLFPGRLALTPGSRVRYHAPVSPRAVSGAACALLTTLLAMPVQAQQPPADALVIFSSNRADGRMETYRSRVDGSEVKRLSFTGGTFSTVSPDGRWVQYRNDSNEVFFTRPDGSETQKLPETWALFWLKDNSGFVLAQGDQVYLYDPDAKQKTPLFKLSDFSEFNGTLFHPYAMTHDNRYLFVGSDMYQNGFTGANGTFQQNYSAILIDLLDKRKIYMVGFGCWPFTPPEGDIIYHIRGDMKGETPTWPDVYRMNLADLDSHKSYEPELTYPDADWGHEYHPHISNDNKWLIYMTSNGCHWDYSCNNEIFLHALGSGPKERIRVTNDPSFDGFPDIYIGPQWDPAGPPRVIAAPDRVTFFAREARLPEARTIKIKNGGAGSIAALGAATVAVDPPAAWLDAQISGGTLVVKPRDGLVIRGKHRATVRLTVEGAAGPTLIPIALDADDSFPQAMAPADAGADAGVDAASGGASPAPAKSSGGGCSYGMGASAMPAAMVGGLMLAALAIARRRRRRRP
jgi:hypothetical protein